MYILKVTHRVGLDKSSACLTQGATALKYRQCFGIATEDVI